MKMLNLGCGHIQPKGWENVDGSLRAWTACYVPFFDSLLVKLHLLPPTEFNRDTRVVNLSARLPWQDGSVDVVYLGEVLEHFTLQGGERLLKECLRILKPGEVIRIRVPDTVRFWRRYLDEFNAAYQKPRSQWTENHTRWIEMWFRDTCVRRSQLVSLGHYHKWMYDEISLISTLERLGFSGVRRRSLHESAIPDIEEVERREDLTVEARKPVHDRMSTDVTYLSQAEST